MKGVVCLRVFLKDKLNYNINDLYLLRMYFKLVVEFCVRSFSRVNFYFFIRLWYVFFYVTKMEIFILGV